MPTLHEDELWILSFEPDKKYIKTSWKGKVLSHEDFDAKTWLIVKYIEQYEPKYFLADARKFDYPITPEKQTWHNEILFPIFKKIDLDKMAIVVPQDLFTEVSVVQAYDENTEVFITQYFENEEDALKWLDS